MPTIIIRNLDELTKRNLQLRAALNGRSMETEAREILRAHASVPPLEMGNLGELAPAIEQRFESAKPGISESILDVHLEPASGVADSLGRLLDGEGGLFLGDFSALGDPDQQGNSRHNAPQAGQLRVG